MLLIKGNKKKIITFGTKLLDIIPEQEYVLLHIAKAQYALKNVKEAVASAEKAFLLDPGVFEVSQILAYIYSKEKNSDAAYKYAQHIVNMETDTTRERGLKMKPFSRIIPIFDANDTKFLVNSSQKKDWIKWAKEYISWYKKQFKTID